MIYLLMPVLLFLAACGDGDDGSGDTILTGLSGVLIFGILAVWLYTKARKGRTK